MDQQHASLANNVAGNQHNNYLHWRSSLLQDIAAAKTKGRWLILIGAAMSIVGFAMFAASVLSFMSQIADGFRKDLVRQLLADPFGPDVAGLPVGLLGWAISVIGIIVLIVGVVVHVVATARRRQVERDLPPWFTPHQF
jgi:uncharacterized membrane protein